jgi:NAD-dependent oxidoreductase involved in siderophore biosynthesis
MADERKRKLRALTPREVSQLIDLACAIVAFDLLTGGNLRRLASRYVAYARRTWAEHDPVSPTDASALQEEARTITREAAPRG